MPWSRLSCVQTVNLLSHTARMHISYYAMIGMYCKNVGDAE
jgi:hypothetical protein